MDMEQCMWPCAISNGELFRDSEYTYIQTYKHPSIHPYKQTYIHTYILYTLRIMLQLTNDSQRPECSAAVRHDVHVRGKGAHSRENVLDTAKTANHVSS